MHFALISTYNVVCSLAIVGGVRRYLLRKQLYEEIKDEVLREQNEERPVEEYCTEYDGNFNGDGYHLEEEYKIDSEV